MFSNAVENKEQRFGEQTGGSDSAILYHGVSSTQRGGNSIDKVLSIIDCGHLFPGGKRNFTTLDLAKMAVVAHADARGVRDSNPVSVDEYVERCGDAELLEKPSVKEYLANDKEREAAKLFHRDTIVPGLDNRDYTNWFDASEDDTKATYGDEAYLEFAIPRGDVYTSFKGASLARTHKPLSLEHARRLVLGNQYAAEAPALKKKLEDKDFGHVRVEVRDE